LAVAETVAARERNPNNPESFIFEINGCHRTRLLRDSITINKKMKKIKSTYITKTETLVMFLPLYKRNIDLGIG